MKEVICEVKTGFNPPTDAQREALRTEALSEIRKAALNQGIVEQTIENAKTALSEFTGALGIEAVIEFDEDAYDPDAPY